MQYDKNMSETETHRARLARQKVKRTRKPDNIFTFNYHSLAFRTMHKNEVLEMFRFVNGKL